MSQLRTFEGELLHLSVSVELKRLEGLLQTLDRLPFPVNPEIVHHGHATAPINFSAPGRPAAPSSQHGSSVDVHFPAYDRRMPAVITSLEQAGFTRNLLSVKAALTA